MSSVIWNQAAWPQRKSVASIHMGWRTIPSFRARATLARLAPRRLAIPTAHALSLDHFDTLVRMTWAASNRASRTEASPALLIAPSRSLSPDWYFLGVRPKQAVDRRPRGSSTPR